MKVLAVVLCLAAAASARMAYTFSDGYLDILGAEPVQNFDCTGRRYGYYADVDASCRVFHVCLPVTDEEGQLIETAHFSFFCGNETMFDQESLTCANEENAFPCSEAETLYELTNAEFGRIPEGGFVPQGGFVPEVSVLARSNPAAAEVTAVEETRNAPVAPVETPVAEASVSEAAEVTLNIPASVPETAEVAVDIPAAAAVAAPEVAEASVNVPDNAALYSGDEEVTEVTSSDEPSEVTEDNNTVL